MRTVLAILLGCVIGCAQPPPTVPSRMPAPPETSEPPRIEAAPLRGHIAFLADDARMGRGPGTAADLEVQAYVERQMKQARLQPAFDDGYRQSFAVTDGVAVRDGGRSRLEIGGTEVAHDSMVFTTDTTASGPAKGPLVYVGYGIAGDYDELGSVAGAIVVARRGAPDDPHLTAADTRPQSKLIAARDHGAVGFVLWDPDSDVSLGNHGEFNDAKIPAVFVGAGANAVMLGAFTSGKKPVKSIADLRAGARSSDKASLQTDVAPVVLRTANVAGRIPGNGSAESIVVIGAHMDHLGLGNASSLAPGERAVHNGADDNASGVAVMLEVCRALAELPPERRAYEILCVAFGAEEMGLLGSKRFVAELEPVVRDRIVAMLNFDMVGRLGPEGLVVAGTGTSSAWPELIEAHRESLVVRSTEDGYGPSDHSSFYEADIPVLHFFTGPHEDYHKPTDDLDKIEVDGAVAIARFALAITRAVMDERLVLDLVRTTRKEPARGGFRVSLGTIPDYAAQVDGLRLSGVRGGGPADKAGLRKGDVITRLGAREIHNLDDYMAAFAELKPGQEITVGVQRDGQAIELKLVPAAPQ